VIRKKVGERIKELRQAQNISQEKLALKADIDRTYLASVEQGKRNIAIINLEKIVIALDTTLEVFSRACNDRKEGAYGVQIHRKRR